MKIAVEGCAHGELDKIYDTIDQLQKQNRIVIDLLIICGDFQSVRNLADLQCMAVPPKYRKLNTFYKYYSGVKKAPILTIFVGGNHEASNYLSELPYGGWVCPNIYYLGYANVINIGGLRIAGLSGIFKGRDYLKGHYECPPYDEGSKKSVYHVRNIDVFRLKQIKKPIDIFVSHDWPTGVYNFGNKDDLLRQKPFFKDEVSNNSLGSKPNEELLMKLKPSFWFAAHLHCKFAAVVPHDTDGDTVFTKFLALDKCLPFRKFLQVINIPTTSGVDKMEYDLEWLSILSLTNHLLSVKKTNNYMPGDFTSERWTYSPSSDKMNSVCDLLSGDLNIPSNFVITAPSYDPSRRRATGSGPKAYLNPQTERFCKALNLTDPLAKLLNVSSDKTPLNKSFDPNEIELSDDSDDEPETNTDLDSSANTDLNTSGSSDFFIDKVGTDFKHQSISSTSAESFSFPEIKEPSTELDKTDTVKEANIDFEHQNIPSTSAESFSFPEIKEPGIEPDRTDTNEETPPKKFKRRNYALYNSDDEI